MPRTYRPFQDIYSAQVADGLDYIITLSFNC